MSKFSKQSDSRYSGPVIPVIGVVALLTLMPALAFGASISGFVTDIKDGPLYRVPICLKTDFARRACAKLRWTDQQGEFRFNGLKEGVPYRVEVFSDTSASGRKFEKYGTYVWGPIQQSVLFSRRKDSAQLATFVGKFNFSNFQRVLTLTSTDFPELSAIDLQNTYVFLKVYLPSTQEGQAPETIFLGQVRSAERLQIEASLPLSVSALSYEIYHANLSVTGSVELTEF